jgi:hypothetical protein
MIAFPTPELVEQRLSECAELDRFSRSILQLASPLQTDAQLTRRALCVERSPLAARAFAAGPTEQAFHAFPSARQHLVGDEYSCWFPLGAPLSFVPLRGILVGVIDGAGRRCDWLGPDAEGAVLVQFPQGAPAFPSGRFALGDVSLLRLRKAP